MNRVVPLGRAPVGQGRRQRHIDEKFHRANPTLSSAGEAAYCNLIDVFGLEVRVVGEDLIARAAGSEQPKRRCDREPEAADPRRSGENTSAVREFHEISIIVPGAAKEFCDRPSCKAAAQQRLAGVAKAGGVGTDSP